MKTPITEAFQAKINTAPAPITADKTNINVMTFVLFRKKRRKSAADTICPVGEPMFSSVSVCKVNKLDCGENK